jgi:chromosome partitioning protein
MRAIAIVNQKGGCGKTITAINLSALLAAEHRRVLLVDLDPQGHATLGLQRAAVESGPTVSEVLLHAATLHEAACRVRPGLDVVPADIRLAAAPEVLAGIPGREDRLADALRPAAGAYDYVIVDCPPTVGLLTFNALKACAEAIVPVDPSFFSLHGIAKFLETIAVVAGRTGHEIAARALVTLYTGRSAFSRAVVDEIRRHFGDRSYETVIRFSVKLAEAASHGVPVSDYSRRCTGFEDYQALAREVLGQEPAAMASAATETYGNGTRGRAPVDRGSAPIPSGQGVIFSVEAPHARCVQIAGDFNGWTVSGAEMERSGPLWWTVLPLSRGRYHYRYVVDGRWQADPSNPDAEPSPYGDLNSVVTVP